MLLRTRRATIIKIERGMRGHCVKRQGVEIIAQVRRKWTLFKFAAHSFSKTLISATLLDLRVFSLPCIIERWPPLVPFF